MKKSLFFVALSLGISPMFFAQSEDWDAYNDYDEFECSVCKAIEDTPFIDCDYVEQLPYVTRVDLSHLMTNRQLDEALFLVIQINGTHFVERIESMDVAFSSYDYQHKQQPETQSMLCKVKPGDQTGLTIGFIYAKNSKNKILKVEFCFCGKLIEGDTVSIVNPVKFNNGVVIVFRNMFFCFINSRKALLRGFMNVNASDHLFTYTKLGRSFRQFDICGLSNYKMSFGIENKNT